MRYRCYYVNQRSETAGGEIIDADSDSDALNRADTLFGEKGSGFNGVEVWDRWHRIERKSNDSQEQIRRWRMKAEEIRTAADGFSDGSARQHMRNSAESYDALANAAEVRLERQKNRTPEDVREQSRLARQASANARTVEMKREHASRAFALAQLAEKIEREKAEAGAAAKAASCASLRTWRPL